MIKMTTCNVFANLSLLIAYIFLNHCDGSLTTGNASPTTNHHSSANRNYHTHHPSSSHNNGHHSDSITSGDPATVVSAIGVHSIDHQPPANLTCYACSTFDDQNCKSIKLNATTTTLDEFEYKSESNQNQQNSQIAIDQLVNVARRTCLAEEHYCSVTRVEYVTGDSKKRTFWALERSCSSSCIEGCIVLGKLLSSIIFCQ